MATSLSCDNTTLGATFFDASATPAQMLFCLKSGAWTPAGGGWYPGTMGTPSVATTTTSALVGISTSSPQATLDVNGEVRVGNSKAGCTSSNAGTMQYDSTLGCTAVCNGSSYVSMCGAGAVGAGGCPVKDQICILTLPTAGTPYVPCIVGAHGCTGGDPGSPGTPGTYGKYDANCKCK